MRSGCGSEIVPSKVILLMPGIRRTVLRLSSLELRIFDILIDIYAHDPYLSAFCYACATIMTHIPCPLYVFIELKAVNQGCPSSGQMIGYIASIGAYDTGFKCLYPLYELSDRNRFIPLFNYDVFRFILFSYENSP